MAYDAAAAERIRSAVTALPEGLGATTVEQFGGIAFAIHGNMAVGIFRGDLLVRVPPEHHDAIGALPHAAGMRMGGGREPRGWIVVAPAGWKTDEALAEWVARGVAFAAGLPRKEKAAARPKAGKRPRTS